jgi:DNA-binding CsgD family transcriptional regulator
MFPCRPRPAGALANASASRYRVCAGSRISSTTPSATAIDPTGDPAVLLDQPLAKLLPLVPGSGGKLLAMQDADHGFRAHHRNLIDLVRVAADGHTVLSAVATRRLLAATAERETARDRRLALVRDLTERERQVLACLGEGMSNAQIARRLHLTEATVKGYVSRMLVKLKCDNRTRRACLPSKRASPMARDPLACWVGITPGSGPGRWRPRRASAARRSRPSPSAPSAAFRRP